MNIYAILKQWILQVNKYSNWMKDLFKVKILVYRCSECNGYCIGNRHCNQFEFWMTFVFHFTVMPKGKAWIHLFFIQLWVNQSRRRKNLNSNQLYSTYKLTLCHTVPMREYMYSGLKLMCIYIYIYIYI